MKDALAKVLAHSNATSRSTSGAAVREDASVDRILAASFFRASESRAPRSATVISLAERRAQRASHG